ncbi:MAG: hypothetical protein HYV23_05055, partial [Deltaproteobacteria bacterium]|nr:hypothetical protein [Deltaproteobacteria bacterium]
TLMGERTGKKFRLADPVKVKVTRVDIERRRIELVLYDEAAEAKEKEKGRKKQRR